jgi:MFS family permease
MTLGGAVMAFGTAWEAQIAGRVLAGVGGVVLNVLMSKMVTDWFAGREIATAMGIFVNSWPVGIAIALVAQPFVAAAGGISTAFGLTAVLAALGFAALLVLYRQPPGGASAGGGFPRGAALYALLIASSIWGLYNAGLAMIFGFGPILLTGRGWELAAASSATSLAILVAAASIPLGGYIADRRRDHEPARQGSGAGDAGARHGIVLHAVLWIHGRRTADCRSASGLDRLGRGGDGFWRGDDAGRHRHAGAIRARGAASHGLSAAGVRGGICRARRDRIFTGVSSAILMGLNCWEQADETRRDDCAPGDCRPMPADECHRA